MKWRLGIAATAVALSGPAVAESPLEEGFAGAMRGCEEWVLNPASWAAGVEPFKATVGLGERMGLVKSAPPETLPPEQWRVANHFWRINSTEAAGYMLVVSDQLPVCHITGGGNEDLQPVVETVLSGVEFASRWERGEDQVRGEMISTSFRNREEPSFSMIVSRARKAGERVDRVQVIASASFEFDEDE